MNLSVTDRGLCLQAYHELLKLSMGELSRVGWAMRKEHPGICLVSTGELIPAG